MCGGSRTKRRSGLGNPDRSEFCKGLMVQEVSAGEKVLHRLGLRMGPTTNRLGRFGVWFTYQVGYLPNIPLITKLFIRLCNISTSADFAIVNPEIESTVRVVAHPGLVMNRSPIPTIVRQRKQYAFFAFQTRCKLMFHPIPPIHLSDQLHPQTAEELCKRTTQNCPLSAARVGRSTGQPGRRTRDNSILSINLYKGFSKVNLFPGSPKAHEEAVTQLTNFFDFLILQRQMGSR